MEARLLICLQLCTLVIDSGLQTGDDLQVLGFVSVLPILRDFGIAVASLLLRLSDFNPFLRGEMLAELCEDIFGQTKAVENGAVLDGIQDDMVVWPVQLVSPRPDT